MLVDGSGRDTGTTVLGEQMIRQGKAIAHVAFALAERRHIDRQHDGLATGGFGALNRGGGDGPILEQGELEPDWSGSGPQKTRMTDHSGWGK